MHQNNGYGKKTERELETLREDFNDLKLYLDEIKNILPVSICTLSSLWIIVDINKAAEKLTGYKPLEIIGKTIDFIFKDERNLKKAKEEAEKGKEVSEELRLISKNKKEVPVNLSVMCRRDSQKNIIGYFAALTDITEIKKRVEELEKFHRLSVGRELKMVELKEKVEKIKKELEKTKKVENRIRKK